jgi:hypothetical protein
VAQTEGVSTSFLLSGVSSKKQTVAQPTRAEKSIEVIKGLDRTEAKL